MSVLDQFGGKRRRKDNGDPPMTMPLVPRPMDALDRLEEDEERQLARVSALRREHAEMRTEIERQTKLVLRLEAEADIRDETLKAVTAERDQLLHRVAELDTEMGVIATLIVNWGDKVRASMKKPAPEVDMNALAEAVAEEPK